MSSVGQIASTCDRIWRIGSEDSKDSNASYYRARYYDSSTGRFLNEDAARFRGSKSDFYVYVRNRSTRMSDPLGLCPCEQKYWTSSGDPNNPIYDRMKMLGYGLGNLAVGSSKLGFAVGVEIGSGGLGTVLAGAAALSSAGNLTAGMIQV